MTVVISHGLSFTLQWSSMPTPHLYRFHCPLITALWRLAPCSSCTCSSHVHECVCCSRWSCCCMWCPCACWSVCPCSTSGCWWTAARRRLQWTRASIYDLFGKGREPTAACFLGNRCFIRFFTNRIKLLLYKTQWHTRFNQLLRLIQVDVVDDKRSWSLSRLSSFPLLNNGAWENNGDILRSCFSGVPPGPVAHDDWGDSHPQRGAGADRHPGGPTCPGVSPPASAVLTGLSADRQTVLDGGSRSGQDTKSSTTGAQPGRAARSNPSEYVGTGAAHQQVHHGATVSHKRSLYKHLAHDNIKHGKV